MIEAEDPAGCRTSLSRDRLNEAASVIEAKAVVRLDRLRRHMAGATSVMEAEEAIVR